MRVTLFLAGDGYDSMPAHHLARKKKPTQLLTEVEDKLADKGLLTAGNALNLRWMQIWWTWPSE